MTRVLDIMRSWVGLAWPDPRFRAIVEPYWQPGYGSTCMVVVTGALAKAGVPAQHVNRGIDWKPGDHMKPLIAYAKSKGAYYDAPKGSDLKPGDVYFLARNSMAGADHAGFIEKNDGVLLTTLDGGQGDQYGNQMINRVMRPIDSYDPTGGVIGKRALLWRIDTSKIVGGSTVDTEAIKAYLDQVEADWEKTQREVSKQQAESITNPAIPPLPFSRADFLSERNSWRTWYLEQKTEWWLDDDVYDAAREWHRKQKVWADMLFHPPKGQTEVPKPKPEDSPFGGFGGGFSTGVLVLGAGLAGAAYFLSKPKRGRR